jgi:hypothetical protein
MFGHRALSHTVCSSSVRMIRSSSRKFSPPENRTFSHAGRGCPPGGGAGLFGSMLKGAAIFQSQRLKLISFYASETRETIRSSRSRESLTPLRLSPSHLK